ncbi:MAG TPA: hypothetical protein PKW95_06405 [bacterium]|nr:hypothetical protein [bacterium]
MPSKKGLLLIVALAVLTFPTWLYPYFPRFDSGAYIMGVASLADGHLPQILSHPLKPPAVYPPVTMLLLTPAYWLGGGSDAALRVALALLWLATMVLLLYAADESYRRDYWPWLLALTGTGSVWLYCGRVQSEIPYLFISTAALVCLDRLKTDHRFFGGPWGPAALIFVFLTPLTRQIGLMLAVSAAIYLAWDRHRRKRGLILALLFAVVGLAPGVTLYSVTQPGQFSPEKSSLLRKDGWDPTKGQQELVSRATLGRIKMNAVNSLQLAPASLFVFDTAPKNPALRAVLIGLALLMALGFFQRLIRGPTAAEYYLVLYLALLWLTPWLVRTRFFTVLAPWLAYYLIQGIDQVSRWVTRRDFLAQWVTRVIVLALVATNLASLATYDFHDRWSRIDNNEARMYEWGARQVEPGQLVLVRDPFAFYVLHGKQALSYSVSEQKYQPPYRLSRYLQQGGKVDAILYARTEKPVVERALDRYRLQVKETVIHPAGWALALIDNRPENKF